MDWPAELTAPGPGARLPPPPPLCAAEIALFLDCDGTLAEIAPTPDEARVAPSMQQALVKAHRALDGRLAVVSGRSLAQLDAMLPLAGLALAGTHGLERRRADGSALAPGPAPGLDEARRAFLEFVKRHPGALVEDKGLALALHYRRAPGAARAAHLLAEELGALHGLVVQPGKMVVELRPPGGDKGEALSAFMREPPFAGHSPVFVGDDQTDEPAFAAARALGGMGILVGAPRPTAAEHGLCRVGDVEALLRSLA